MKATKRARRMLKLADVIEQAGKKHFHMGSWFNDPSYGRIDNLTELPNIDYPAAVDAGIGFEVSDVREFFDRHEARKPVSCGMTACLGGWAVLTWPEEALDMAATDIDDDGSIYRIAPRLLGYNRYDDVATDRLFAADAPWKTPKQAARELRRRAGEILLEEYSD